MTRTDGEAVVSIPGAPERRLMIAFQMALVERIRAILRFRALERAGVARDAERDEVDRWTSTIRAMIAEHQFPFMTTCEALGLGPGLRDALALVAAPHLDGSLRDSIAAFDMRHHRHVDAVLAIELIALDRSAAIAARTQLGEGGILHRAGLIESVPVTLPHFASSLEHELVPTPRLLRLLDGQAGLDPRFDGPLAVLVDTDPDAHVGVLETDSVDEAAMTATSFERALGTSRGATLLISGARGIGKLRLARALAARCGISRLIVADAALLPGDGPRLARVLQGLVAEAELLRARLVLRGVEHRADSASHAGALLSILRSLRHPTWATSDVDPRVEHGAHVGELAAWTISIPHPDLSLRLGAWTAELRSSRIDIEPEALHALAAEYPLTRSAIGDVVVTYASAEHRDETRLYQLAEAMLPGQLGRFARRGKSRARMADLVLADHVREQLEELGMAVANRSVVHAQWRINERHAVGRGVVALFNGPPGTGKTMAANVLANELGLPLYRIDTSAIVDRYVGETEKNLMRLFDEALASRAVLLFDEADSLFGRRVDARDATDRHANTQINVLLNLIEDYDGFVMLTTNMKGALDSAFLRRIMFKISFDLPDVNERTALWAYHLPPDIPLAEDVDLEHLAREYDRASGGDIKNAVLRAILATGGTAPISHQLLQRSMINELRANGSVIAERAGSSSRSSLV